MSSTVLHLRKTWTKGPHLISTDPTLIPTTTLNTWFASKEVYWAKPMPEEAMRQTLQNSLCFGLYHTNTQPDQTSSDSNTELELIGFARCITDTTTFIYLTDVFVLPSCQGLGLGSWLVACVQEVIESMPYLRRSLLFTGDWRRSVPFYEKVMGMHVMEGARPVDGGEGVGLAVMQRKFAGAPGFEGV
jgi:GNAT superfamily N-acetyltransferase